MRAHKEPKDLNPVSGSHMKDELKSERKNYGGFHHWWVFSFRNVFFFFTWHRLDVFEGWSFSALLVHMLQRSKGPTAGQTDVLAIFNKVVHSLTDLGHAHMQKCTLVCVCLCVVLIRGEDNMFAYAKNISMSGATSPSTSSLNKHARGDLRQT